MDKELDIQLNSFLEEINECLALGDMGLLKSSVLHETKWKIEDKLKEIKPKFGKIDSLKIEKAISPWRTKYKSDNFVNSGETNKVLEKLHVLIQDLINSGGSEFIPSVPSIEIKTTNSTIIRAIGDARVLIEKNGDSVSAVDRLHTLLMAYFRELCEESDIKYTKDDTLNQLLKLLKSDHAVFKNPNGYTEHIIKSLSNILDKLNPMRNDSSMAHANQDLLKPEEAMLVVDTINTILRYFVTKVSTIKKDS